MLPKKKILAKNENNSSLFQPNKPKIANKLVQAYAKKTEEKNWKNSYANEEKSSCLLQVPQNLLSNKKDARKIF